VAPCVEHRRHAIAEIEAVGFRNRQPADVGPVDGGIQSGSELRRAEEIAVNMIDEGATGRAADLSTGRT